MKKNRPNQNDGKTSLLKLFEGAVLMICLAVLALRSTYTESSATSTINTAQPLTNEAMSIIISSVLLLTALAWFGVSFVRAGFTFRFTGIETGFLIFLIGGLIGLSVASNKRAAINNLTLLAGPMLAAVALVHILNSPAKIKLVLIVILSLAATCSYQCFDQFFSSNAQLIEDYEKNPERHLNIIGAEPGSLKHFQYEHRLYSKDTKGFFTTGNSAGSFMMLCAFVALGLTADATKRFKKSSSPAYLFCCCLLLVLITAGFLITQSKGAILAGTFAAVMFIAWLLLGGILRRYKKPILIFVLLAVVLAAGFIVSYGVRHEKLPGGNSMFVRWQYWTGTAKIISHHFLTGVGPGNFVSYYPWYKNPAAVETVQDPHNFLLSLLSQYGPLGLVGFLAGVVFVLGGIIKKSSGATEPATTAKPDSALFVTAFILISVVLLAVRPFFIAAEMGSGLYAFFCGALIIYILPFVVFAVCVVVLFLSELIENPGTQADSRPVLKAAIFCGIVGVLIHNTIDFAIFEPGVLTLLWVMIACASVLSNAAGGEKYAGIRLPLPVRIVGCTVIIISFYCVIAYALIPTARGGAAIQNAMRNPYEASRLFAEAAEYDSLNPDGPYLAGRWSLQGYMNSPVKDNQFLVSAAGYFTEASLRNKADFKAFEKLCETYALMAQDAGPEQKKQSQAKALAFGLEALQRYPGSDRLNLKAADIAYSMAENDLAMKYYKRAVEIEDAYRKQFSVMYPDMNLFSRLGQAEYLRAKEMISKLGGPVE